MVILIYNEKKGGLMALGFQLAKSVAKLSRGILKHIMRRPAQNFPGKIALYFDKNLLHNASTNLKNSICVVGTNGKTTVTNMLADIFETEKKFVVCNRSGANLDSGIASSLLEAQTDLKLNKNNIGVFECDELWLARILPYLQSDYVVLLNLFRDQLDRVGEIDRIQHSIVKALESSPNTTLIYNCDDPHCEYIARLAPNTSLGFGVDDSLNQENNSPSDAIICQLCSSFLSYSSRQYSQLGKYTCCGCGFERTNPLFFVYDVTINEREISFNVALSQTKQDEQSEGQERGNNFTQEGMQLSIKSAGVYMIYNLLAVSAAALLFNTDPKKIKQAIKVFEPHNGRLERYSIGSHNILLNLAKNPTGFDQNISIITSENSHDSQGSQNNAVGFFVNDKEGDGRDISWIWDIDFEKLTSLDLNQTRFFVGGMRRNDLQVRLKYAGINSCLVNDPDDILSSIPQKSSVYMIANYTALPEVKASLDKIVANNTTFDENKEEDQVLSTKAHVDISLAESEYSLTLVQMYPLLLNLYGDNGNMCILEKRIMERGVAVRHVLVKDPKDVNFEEADIVFIGGGPDKEQKIAAELLLQNKDDLSNYIEDNGVALAICGGFQILGKEWACGDDILPGLGILDYSTKKNASNVQSRLTGNVLLQTKISPYPVIGYENHAGRTYFNSNLRPFGTIVNNHGTGNNEEDMVDGVLYKNFIGTYLHGPLLAKNPEIADYIIEKALKRKYPQSKIVLEALSPLGDEVENEARNYMYNRLGYTK